MANKISRGNWLPFSSFHVSVYVSVKSVSRLKGISQQDCLFLIYEEIAEIIGAIGEDSLAIVWLQ